MKIQTKRPILGRRPVPLAVGPVWVLIAACVMGCNHSRDAKQLPLGHLDTPTPGVTASGSIRLSGWALADSGISRIDVYLDGKLVYSGRVGIRRPDVQKVYPNFRDADISGFDFQLPLDSVAPGTHHTYQRDSMIQTTAATPVPARWLRQQTVVPAGAVIATGHQADRAGNFALWATPRLRVTGMAMVSQALAFPAAVVGP
jgi:hypothetical protein